jgi:hypothetical protein
VTEKYQQIGHNDSEMHVECRVNFFNEYLAISLRAKADRYMEPIIVALGDIPKYSREMKFILITQSILGRNHSVEAISGVSPRLERVPLACYAKLGMFEKSWSLGNVYVYI